VEFEGGLEITPKHPVMINEKWEKPGEIGEIKIKDCDAVYNFVLEDGHTMDINGICCATLGHGIKGKNIEHDYFGTDKIISDLKNISGYSKGYL